MYSPTTRLLTVLELLQSHREMSGSELARRLEVDTRTVRRYIVNLQDMGIPVETERGPYGAYRLERGHRLPPLLYSDAEAVALTLGLLAIRELQFPVDVAAVEGAFAKTERVLPDNLLHQVRSLRETLRFNSNYYWMTPPVMLQNDYIVTLSSAVQQSQRVHMVYSSGQQEESERDFDAYGVVYNEGFWYTTGYCHLRQGMRTFRLDRIKTLTFVDAYFEQPADFDALAHVLRSIVNAPGTYQVEVLLKTTMDIAQQIMPPMMGTLEETEEGVILRRTATQLEWIAIVLMCLDFPIVINQPAALHDTLRQMAARALKMVGETS